MSEIRCFSSPIVAVEQLKRSVTSGEKKRKQSLVTSRLFAYQVPRPPFTLSKFANTSFFFNFKMRDSPPFSQKSYSKCCQIRLFFFFFFFFFNFKMRDSTPFIKKTYHKDMTLRSRRSRQLLCHQCNCFLLRLQMLPVKGAISPEESLLLLMS